MESEKTFGIKIKHKETEKARKYLNEKKIIRSDLKIKKDQNFSYIPINIIDKNIKFEIVEKKFEKHKIKNKSYKDLIDLNEDIKNNLPNSFDIIGNIILIKLPRDFIKFQNEIGEALIKTYKNIKTVCFIKPVSGEFRTRNISYIYGEYNKSTIHCEFGVKYYIDVKKAYFSPRLANERNRISNLVKKNEIIVDLFAGVGPFSIMIAKYAYPKKIYLVDKNNYAIKLARKNILLNNVLDKIEILNIDAKKIDKYILKDNEKADRVIMNLPFLAFNYFDKVLSILSNKGIIHYYDIIEEKNIDQRIKSLKRISENMGYRFDKINLRKIKSYSPREFYICLDITAKKIADVA